MSYWNHRVIKETLSGEDWYTVREVFYNADGTIYAYTEDAVDISGESIAELREYTEWVLRALDKPVLIDGEVEFVDYTEDADGNEAQIPCTCPPDCPVNCKGECGCKACHDAYQDFLSVDYD